ncbi:MAG: glycerol kinase GlpK [Alphaproteobacteria bacterium]
MSSSPVIMSIDQGTSSSRVMLIDGQGKVVAQAQREFASHYPQEGWVEHDAAHIWSEVLDLARTALTRASLDAADVAGIGITNQRETIVLWDRQTGEPLHNAIVWQDRRTADYCASLRDAGHEDMVRDKTGLVLDPYFSATKLAWLLDNVEGARKRAEAGELAAGTIECWLLYKLTGGASHKTDISNAARTMLLSIHSGDWDDELLSLLNIPRSLLPTVCDNASEFGQTAPDLFGTPIPIRGMAGDQQAATFGQACFERGMMKSTYGTGCFAVLNTGSEAVPSHNKMLTTIGWRLDGQITYALEGSIFVAGQVIKWLRDEMGLISTAAESETFARSLTSSHGVHLVPAFAGLGAPYWDAGARAAITGMTLGTNRRHIVRAALEAVAFQTQDLMHAMADDMQRAGLPAATELKVDGGMVGNDWLCQRIADITALPVSRPTIAETTALGAAWLAGLQSGMWSGLDDLSGQWAQDAAFAPAMDEAERQSALQGWAAAVARVRS